MWRAVEFTGVLAIAFFMSVSPARAQVALPGEPGGLRNLAVLRDGVKRQRFSSYDRTGGNNDHTPIPAGGKLDLARIDGPGTITHLWMTIADNERYYLRKIVLRAYWDGETEPSVESPVGDFFGAGFGEPTYLSTEPLQVADRGMNCFFPMPFSKGAHIELENQGSQPIRSLYFYVDYESYAPDSDSAKTNEKLGRFHCWWNHQLTTAHPENTVNLDGKDNYLICDATGKGQFIGVVMHIQGMQTGWWGEGDDMFFIDGDEKPTLNGTGLEDYFGGAWNFNGLKQVYQFPFLGYARKGNDDYTGRHSMYRFHIADPIMFDKSLKATIEHGTANNRGDDYSSTAYWYQTLPHKPFPPMQKVEDRLPIDNYTVDPKK